MRSEALRLNVTGWVRNTSDGTVEAVVHGEDAAVDALIKWAHRGPPQARVERVEVEPGESLGPFTGFDKRVD